MRGKLVVAVACSVGASAWIAGASDPGAQSAKRSAPAVSAAEAFRLPSVKCARAGRVRVSFAPPAGVTFAVLSVQAGGEQALQLASLSGPGTVTVRLPDSRARVRINATTTDGQYLDAERTYRRCVTPRRLRSKPSPKPKPKPRPVIIEEGGGED